MLNSNSTRHQLLLAAIAASMYFANLGGAHLWDVDEAIFSQAAKEMLARGDYVTPYFNGQVFPDKPAMMYWLMIGAYQVFGPTEFAARFPSALFGIASVLLTYRLGRLIFSPAAGFWSALALASAVNFNVIARAATPDSFLTFFSTLALLLFAAGTSRARPLSGERNAPWAGQTRFEPSWTTYALAYAAMGCGVLTKGPVGVVLPTAVIGLFLLIMRAPPSDRVAEPGRRAQLIRWLARLRQVFSPLHVLHTIWSMRPLTAVAAVLAVAAGWYVWVGIETDGQWLVGFFGVHNFGRFLNAMENHRGPILYYFPAIAIGFFPWSVLLLPSLLFMRRNFALGQAWRPGYVLVGSWICVWVGFFSLAGTKLPSYIVPAYPPIALVVGSFVARSLAEPTLLSKAWRRMAWGTIAVVGIGMIIALPIVAHIFLADDFLLGLIGLVPLTGAVIGIVLSERGQWRGAICTLSATGVGLAVAVFGVGAAYVDRYQESPALAAAIARSTRPGMPPSIGAFRHFRPSFVFYTDHTIEKLESPAEVEVFFAAHGASAFLLTTDVQYEKLRPQLPADVSLIESRPRFLRPGKVILLGRPGADSMTAARPSDETSSTRE